MENSHKTSVSDVDLLSVSVGKVDNEFRLIMSYRLNPDESFKTTNLAITEVQAVRLYRDLNNLCSYNDTMKQALVDNPSLYKTYETCVLNGTPVVVKTKKRRKKQDGA